MTPRGFDPRLHGIIGSLKNQSLKADDKAWPTAFLAINSDRLISLSVQCATTELREFSIHKRVVTKT